MKTATIHSGRNDNCDSADYPPTESSEPLWYTQEMTRKEWAVLCIREQPFYA